MITRGFRSATMGMVLVGLTMWLSLAEATSLSIVSGVAETDNIPSRSTHFTRYATDLSSSLIVFNLYGKRVEQADHNKEHLSLNAKNSLFGNVLENVWEVVYPVTSKDWTDLLDMNYRAENATKVERGVTVPDAHQITTSSEPSQSHRILSAPGILLLLGTGFVGLALWRRQACRKQSSLRALFSSASPSDKLFLQQAFFKQWPY